MNPIARVLYGGAAILLVGGSLGAAESKPEVATIIDKATAESILGGMVKDPTPLNVEGKDGYYSKCNYYSVAPGRLLMLRIYQAGTGFNASKELDHVHATSGLTKSISGLGDKAEVASGVGSGLSEKVTMIYVVKGNTLITVGLRGFDEDTAVEKVKTIAQKILEHL